MHVIFKMLKSALEILMIEEIITGLDDINIIMDKMMEAIGPAIDIWESVITQATSESIAVLQGASASVISKYDSRKM